MKTCSTCKLSLNESDFPNSKLTKNGLDYRCKKCKKHSYRSNVKKDPERVLREKINNYKRHAKLLYQLTNEELDLLFQKANNSCQICGSINKLCIDHCHQTGKTRGILCRNCNVGLGFFQDNKKWLIKAIAYLN